MKENNNVEVDLKKEIKRLRDDFELEKSNIRANYIANFLLILSFFFWMDVGTFDLFSYTITPLISFLSTAFLIVVFYYKDLVNYSKYLIQKILGVKK